MPIYVRNLKLALEEPEHRLIDRLAARLRIPRNAIRHYAPVRRSLDARRKGEIGFIYNVEVTLDEPVTAQRQRVRRLSRQDVSMIEDRCLQEPILGTAVLAERPVIVGFGPAGMFAAYQLARFGYRPIVLERGQPVRIRHRDVMDRFYHRHEFDPESNLLFGEGGAGTYSDGKLYTRVNDARVQFILQVLYEHGASPDILLDGRPHIGSDRLPNICMRLRQRIERDGGEVRFAQRVTDLCQDEDGRITGLEVDGQTLSTRHVILAIGHSARDTLRRLIQRKVRVAAKPFQLGVRIEHPQSMVDRWQYGQLAGHDRLPPADYRIVAKGAAGAHGDLFSFCMCPGGMILPTNESRGLIATNGASRANRQGRFANSGLVITIQPQQFKESPLAGIEYQERLEALAFKATGESYAVPAQRAPDFVRGRFSDGTLETSYPLGGQWTDLRTILPDCVAQSLLRGLELLDRQLPGFAGDEGLITAPETRASAPIRILRDPDSRLSVSTPGLYPVGEGAGYAGGIISAALDGLKTADQLIGAFAPPR